MTRNINEYLASGEAGNISATNLIAASNLKLTAADTPDAEGMVMVMGSGGLPALEPRPTSNTVDEDINNTEVALVANTESAEIFTVPTTVDFTDTGDSGYKLFATFTNTKNQDRTVTIRIYDDGVEIGTATQTVASESVNEGMLFSGALTVNIATSSVVTVTFQSSGNQVTFNGNTTAGRFQLIKAPPATAIQVDRALNVDYNLYVYNGNLGPSLSRAEIEASLGTDRPNICVIQDTSGHLFRVIYSSVQDKFFSTNYTEAT